MRVALLLNCMGGEFAVPSVFAAEATQAARDHSGEYYVRQWTTDQGLPQNTIHCICQTKDGYIWVGTRDGLARYDGRRFTVFKGELAFGDPGDSDILALVEDSAARLWIQTRSGLISYERGQFRRYSFRDEPFRGEVLQIISSHKGGLWLSFNDRVSHYESGVITRSFRIDPRLIYRPYEPLREDSDERVWLVQERMCLRLDPRTGTFERLNDVIGSLTNHPTGLFVDRSGSLWMSSPGELLCWKDGRLSKHTIPEAWGNVAAALIEDRAGDLWFRASNLH